MLFRSTFLLESPVPLFSYQQEIVQSLNKWIGDSNSARTALVSLPTGAGKTRTGLWFFREQLECGRVRRLLWIAPSNELVEQAVETAKALWSEFPGAPQLDVSVGTLTLGSTRADESIAFFCTAQLAAKRLDDLRRLSADLLIFDEAHQSVARTFREIIRCQVTQNEGRVVGLSATPGRASADEGEDLQDIFHGNLITSKELGRAPVPALRQSGVLSDLAIETIPLPSQWDQVRVVSLTDRSLSIDELALHPSRFWATIETIRNLPDNAKTLVFGASIAHCYALTAVLQTEGISAVTLSHHTSPSKRRSVLTQFAIGETRVLLNKVLLATGYDCPAITDVVLASPIRSPILWEQIIGRASRGPAVGGTRVGRIWELDDHRKMHNRVLSYARFLADLWS